MSEINHRLLGAIFFMMNHPISEIASELAETAGYTIDWQLEDFDCSVRFSYMSVGRALREIADIAVADMVINEDKMLITFTPRHAGTDKEWAISYE